VKIGKQRREKAEENGKPVEDDSHRNNHRDLRGALDLLQTPAEAEVPPEFVLFTGRTDQATTGV